MPMGYTFGGKHIHEFGCEMTGHDVPVTPPFTNMDENQGGRDGGWDFGIQYDPKIIQVDHYVWTKTRKESQDMIRNMAGHFNPRLGAQEIIFDEEPDKVYYGRLNSQFKIEELLKLFNEFTLEFICYDPFTYSVQEYTEIITNSGTIEHIGTHVSKPILVIDHKGGASTITNTTPDGKTQTVTFKDTAVAGIYTIDMKEGTVKKDDDSGDKYIESIEWIELEQGVNTIAHSANITNVTVKYRHTWL